MIAALISTNYFRKYSPVSTSLDDATILPALEIGQELWAANIVGGSIYQKLQQSVVDSQLPIPIPVPVIEKDLIILVRSCLVWYVSADLLVQQSFLLRNKGVVRNAGETIETVDMADIQILKSEFKAKADAYSKRVTDYLCKHSDYFSLIDQTIKPFQAKSQEVGGIYIPDNRYECRCYYNFGYCNCK